MGGNGGGKVCQSATGKNKFQHSRERFNFRRRGSKLPISRRRSLQRGTAPFATQMSNFCTMHAFDCSVKPDAPSVSSKPFTFYPICIGEAVARSETYMASLDGLRFAPIGAATPAWTCSRWTSRAKSGRCSRATSSAAACGPRTSSSSCTLTVPTPASSPPSSPAAGTRPP